MLRLTGPLWTTQEAPHADRPASSHADRGRGDEYQNAVADEKCRCTIGEDHDQNGVPFDLGEDDGDDDEALSVEDAADMWRSHGMDEDYMFGYSDDQLRNA